MNIIWHCERRGCIVLSETRPTICPFCGNSDESYISGDDYKAFMSMEEAFKTHMNYELELDILEVFTSVVERVIEQAKTPLPVQIS